MAKQIEADTKGDIYEYLLAKLLHLNKSIIQIHILKAFLPVFWRKKDIFLYKNDIL